MTSINKKYSNPSSDKQGDPLSEVRKSMTLEQIKDLRDQWNQHVKLERESSYFDTDIYQDFPKGSRAILDEMAAQLILGKRVIIKGCQSPDEYQSELKTKGVDCYFEPHVLVSGEIDGYVFARPMIKEIKLFSKVITKEDFEKAIFGISSDATHLVFFRAKDDQGTKVDTDVFEAKFDKFDEILPQAIKAIMDCFVETKSKF